jgi:HAMP domain-containing protein
LIFRSPKPRNLSTVEIKMDNKQTIHKRLLSGLQTRLIGLVVLTALVAGGLVSVAAIMDSRNTMREQIITNNLAAADLAARFSANYIEGAETNLRLFGMRPLFLRAVLENDLSQAEMHLAQFMENDKRFDSAAVYTANGIGWAGGLKGKWKNRGGTVADREWFQQTLAIRKPYLGIPILSRGTGHPIVTYAIPIFNDKGNIHAVLVGGISLAELSEAINGMHISTSTQPSLLDTRQGGIYIVHPDPKRILKPVARQNQAVQHALTGEHGTMETRTERGETELSAFAPVTGLPWSILILEPVKTAYAALYTLTVHAALYTVIIMLIATILGVLLVRTITKPVQQLVKGTEEIARGNLDHRIQIRRKDEIGQLSNSFNAMAGDLAETKRENLHLFEELKAWSIELEARVEERTTELIQSNQSLRQSEEKFSKAFQTSPYAITITSTKDGKLDRKSVV